MAISETIAKDKTHQKDAGQLLSKLVFTTLDSVIGNANLEAVGYSICQGWLDIMISSSVARPHAVDKGDEKVDTRMSIAEVSSLFRKTTNFMRSHLNLGSFEGPTGAQKHVVMRLNLACDLLLIAFNVRLKDSDSLALPALADFIEENKRLREEFQASMDDLMTWLFLNARGYDEVQATSELGNAANHTPATTNVKNITEMIDDYLVKLGNNGKSEHATQIALSSLVRVVKQLNKDLMHSSMQGTAGSDALLALSRRANSYFTKFISCWLKTDSIARHFVFELGGFEFLLDTIGKKEDKGSSTKEKQQIEGSSLIDEENDASFSDIHEMLEIAGSKDGNEKSDSKDDAAALLFEDAQDDSKPSAVEEPPQLSLCELANKHLVLTADNTGGQSAATHGKVDWCCNKRAYKNRLMVTALHGALRNEYWVLFKLQ